MANKSYLLFFIFFILAIFVTVDKFQKFDGAKISPELSIYSTSNFGLYGAKSIAASCGYTLHGSSDEYSACTTSYNCGWYNETVSGTSQCGGACNYTAPTCLTQCFPESPSTQTQTLSCSSGYSGAITQTRTSSCPSTSGSPVWSAWSTTSNTCTANCVANAPETRSLSCDTGYTGSITETRTSSCPAATGTPVWSGWSQTGSTCTPVFTNSCLTPTVTYSGYDHIASSTEFYANNGRPTPNYSLSCSTPVPTGYKRVCAITRTSSDNSQNGSWTEDYDANHTIWSNQFPVTYPYTESLSVQCQYYNATSSVPIGSPSPTVTEEAKVQTPNYNLPCTSTANACGATTTGIYDEYGVCNAALPAAPASCTVTNVCGQDFAGNYCPSGCQPVSTTTDVNASCFSEFKINTDTINPDGYVDFTWSMDNLPSNVGSKCSFVDLTSDTPRPIAGLQNLDTQADRVRISNIQTTTRFCFVCQFFNRTTNAILGNTSVHKWIRVQRIGED